MSLTRKEQVAKVLRKGGRIAPDAQRPTILRLYDRHGNELEAWQQAIAGAHKEQAKLAPSPPPIPAPVPANLPPAFTVLSDEQWRITRMALAIADDACRSDIECACREVGSGGASWYDMESADNDDIRHLTRAFNYLRLRGAQCVGFTTHYNPAFPSLIRFEPTAEADPQ